MEQNKNPTASPKTGKPEQPLTEEQRQKRRKMLVYPLMGLLFIGSMWLIFAPSQREKDEAAQGTGFNTEMPLPTQSGIIADKRTAYEQARMEEKQKERRAQMHDLADLFADKEQEEETETEDFDLLNPEAGTQAAPSYGGGGSRPKQTIRSSAAAYEDINRTLGNFYETPADVPEKEEMRERSTIKSPCWKNPMNWRQNICPQDRETHRRRRQPECRSRNPHGTARLLPSPSIRLRQAWCPPLRSRWTMQSLCAAMPQNATMGLILLSEIRKPLKKTP